MIAEDQRHWYYFGCTDGPGHRLIDRQGRWIHIRELEYLDGELCGPRNMGLYQAVVHRLPYLNYSALAWWDHSVDTRPGSNSIIFAPSPSCSKESLYSGLERWFPWVINRLPQKLVLTDIVLTRETS